MKKILILLLAALLLSACSKPSPAAPAAPAAAEQTASPTERPAPAETPAPAPTSSPAPGPDAFIAQAEAILSGGETQENLSAALERYLSALELDADSAEALLGAADIYIRQGNFDQALAFLKERAGHSGNEAIQSTIADLEAGNASDSEGRLRKFTGRPDDGPMFVHLYSYGADGRLSRVTQADTEGNELDHVDITYDDHGNMLTQADYVSTSELAGRLIHTTTVYDEQDRVISCTRVLAGEWTEETVYFHDELGREIRLEMYTDGKLSTIETFEDFDDHDRARKRSVYLVEGQTPVLEYYQLNEIDYDSFTEKQVHYDPNGVMITRIEYQYTPDWVPVHVVMYDADGTIFYEGTGQ